MAESVLMSSPIPGFLQLPGYQGCAFFQCLFYPTESQTHMSLCAYQGAFAILTH